MKKKLDKYRTRKVLSIFPWKLVDLFDLYNLKINDPKFIWTGVWFSFIIIKQEKVKTRYKKFDSGMYYREYWTEWEEKWQFVEIIYK